MSVDLHARLGGFQLHLAHAAAGRNWAILGPSGAGKTLTLRLLAGVARPDHGRVLLDDTGVTRLPPEHRGVGYVPQDSTLLPHLPVCAQVTFGVDAAPALAGYWIARLQLGGVEDRLPSQLSGGQRRRVALARALARAPRLLLLDEPFTGLDDPVRAELRAELRRLQRDTAITTVPVTHDPVEAAQLADEVLVLTDGRLLQAGPQPGVFDRPATAQVARLLGVRNLLAGHITGPGMITAGQLTIAVPVTALPVGTAVRWAIPADRIRLTPAGPHIATITDRTSFTDHTEVLLTLPGGGELTARTTIRDRHLVGAPCHFDLPPRPSPCGPNRRAPATSNSPRPASPTAWPSATPTGTDGPISASSRSPPICGANGRGVLLLGRRLRRRVAMPSERSAPPPPCSPNLMATSPG